MSAVTHWQLNRDADDIAWLTLDCAEQSVNTLSSGVLEDLERQLDTLKENPPNALIFEGAKESGFAAGADVNEFRGISDPADAENLIREVHALFQRIEDLPYPVVCAIHGLCLGGGLELALACHYRVATYDAKLGFPEVMLGIFPGFGGSVRSTRLLKATDAMTMMLTSRNASGKRAYGIGLVDKLTDSREGLKQAARLAALGRVSSRGGGFMSKLMNWGPVRGFLSGQMTKRTRARVRKAHYPAPFALIDHYRQFGGDRAAMFDNEARAVGQLIAGDTAQNLVRVFFLQERMKSLGKKADFNAKRLHVIGAGVMGGDIAAWATLRGLHVTLQDREMKYVEPALQRAKELFRKKLKDDQKVAEAMDRLKADINGDGVPDADVVIEAIFENLEAKQELYKKIEPKMAEHAVLATNTSSIMLEKLATVLERPQRLIGLHFFNPVAKMPLVEVIHGNETEAEMLERGASFVRQISRMPLPVKSAPGFLVNRALTPYMLEAMVMYQEGIQKELIDEAAVSFGMPMGPVELADTVGLDIGLNVGKVLAEAFGGEVPPKLVEMVEAGNKGKKTGQGFYTWSEGKPQKAPVSGEVTEELQQRLLRPLFDTCVECLREDIVEDADLLDGGMIFGTGFAPFRGGPMKYLQDNGRFPPDLANKVP